MVNKMRDGIGIPAGKGSIRGMMKAAKGGKKAC